MRWGREAFDEYEEPGAGRQAGVPTSGLRLSPYWNSSDSALQVIPHVSPLIPAPIGGADQWIEVYPAPSHQAISPPHRFISQVYDFRLCFTDSPGNQIRITMPDSYNSSEWELWRRIYRLNPPKDLAEAGLSCLGPIPNNYTDCGADRACRCHEYDEDDAI